MELIESALPAFPEAPLRAALATDTGRHREHNEDAVGCFRPADPSSPHTPVDLALLVADGVGGHEGGQQASRFVVDAVEDTLAAQARRIDAPHRWLEQLLQSIHRELLAQADQRGTPGGMGSTATLAVIQGRKLTLAHVGDSRAYRLRNGRLEQLTEDHSWVAEQLRAGVLSPGDPETETQRNVLTQCLGIGGSLRVQIVAESLSVGDRYLLCSDGLHGVVPDEEVREVLANELDPDPVARRLIAMANAGGGPDNISAVVLDVGDPPLYDRPAMTGPASALAEAAAAAAAGTSATAPEPLLPAPSISRRAAPWMTGAGALLLMIGAGAWLAGQVGARAASAPEVNARPPSVDEGAAPAAWGVPVPVPPPPFDPLRDPVASEPTERPDSTDQQAVGDTVRPDSLAPRDTLTHPRPE